MAAAYLVTMPATTGQTRWGDSNVMVVYADDAADAKIVAQAKFGAGDDALWAAATVTALVVGATLEGWTFRAVLTDPADGVVAADVEYVGIADDQVDDIGDGLVVALNLVTGIAGAAYDSGTNVLTVAETTDDLGDHALQVYVYPPSATFVGSLDVSFADFYSTVVDEGSANAAVKVTLVAHTIPAFYAAAKLYT